MVIKSDDKNMAVAMQRPPRSIVLDNGIKFLTVCKSLLIILKVPRFYLHIIEFSNIIYNSIIRLSGTLNKQLFPERGREELNIEIGLSTACFYPLDTSESLILAGELGFRKIELFINSESEMEKAYILRLKKICRQFDLQILSAHFYTASFESMMFFSAYERRTADSLKIYERNFDALKELAPLYLTFHGERSAIDGMNFDRISIDKSAEVYKRLCETASRCGIKISQENVAWCRSKNPEYLKALKNAVPQLCFTLDIKQAVRAGQTPEAYLSSMGESLKNIHVNDYNAFDTCLLPGKGIMDYNEFFEMLKLQNYNNDMIIEVYSSNYSKTDDIIKAGEYLKNVVKCHNMS